MSTESELQLSTSQFKHGSKLFAMKNRQEIKLDLGKIGVCFTQQKNPLSCLQEDKNYPSSSSIKYIKSINTHGEALCQNRESCNCLEKIATKCKMS